MDMSGDWNSFCQGFERLTPQQVARMLILALTTAGLTGCMSQPDARYIYQDGQFGVIGIPHNSPFGLKNYMKQADALMTQHFPDGYEVVRSEEVIEGQRVLDRGKKAEFETDPTISALNQKIQLGKIMESFSSQQKDSVSILESRIIYKRQINGKPSGMNGFAASSAVIPENYIDPNAVARCRAQTEIAEARKGKTAMVADAHKTDSAVKKTSDETKTASDAKTPSDPPKSSGFREGA